MKRSGKDLKELNATALVIIVAVVCFLLSILRPFSNLGWFLVATGAITLLWLFCKLTERR